MIPLSVPELRGNEWKYIKECLDTNWVSSVGSYVNRFEKEIAAFTGAGYAIATSNGTAAIHLSLLLTNIEPGDLVIIPDITFVAPANCITYCGAIPLLMDVDIDTWQIDINLLQSYLEQNCSVNNGKCIQSSTGKVIRAVLPVHVLGNICDMDRLQRLAQEWKIMLIEDATEALGSYWNTKHAGTFGFTGCLSFNGNKIITTGGGGMILTDNKEVAEKAKHLSTQAKTTQLEYFHDQVGFNYRLVNILAALGVAQLEQLPKILIDKKSIADRYNQNLNKLGFITGQKVESNAVVNNWLYTVKLPRNRELMLYLKNNNIESRPLWTPLHLLPAFKDCSFITKEKVSDLLYNSCLSLPCSSGISDNDVKFVSSKIEEFYSNG